MILDMVIAVKQPLKIIDECALNIMSQTIKFFVPEVFLRARWGSAPDQM